MEDVSFQETCFFSQTHRLSRLLDLESTEADAMHLKEKPTVKKVYETGETCGTILLSIRNCEKRAFALHVNA